ncbi:enoyl-CoA hydratase/isomerase family protein [Mycolicibacterium brumae]|uniref:enoyl-CoA hydratase/isomerase family protein n=1 Tax=Mycolicibacterium brumae TaxID=85968 RepID=UPI000AAD9F23|nr:enoyl-CoA hydratase-related protein [Mycolicibacterium brumae]RWA19608.1 hypothetical protein MBRU_16755 [Mycolicibacterium brumae DSM 44177]UWW08309.1 enoyl-CoA hydratase-related protein [Mycolicibacterium brumae]
MDDQCLLFEPGPVTRITLNRPRAANGLNAELGAALVEAAQRCASADVVLLTGAGRFFCAGGDLKEISAAPDPGGYVHRLAEDLHRALAIFAEMDAVLITVVNGVAAGAGFSLAVSGDLVLAAESASFTMAYTRAGLSPDGGASYLLPRLVGLRRTQELMLTNRTLTAAEAADWGLVTEVCDDPGARAEELAAQLAAGSRTAQASVKRLLAQAYANDYRRQLADEAAQIAANANRPDGREGMDAFLNKREPRFS